MPDNPRSLHRHPPARWVNGSAWLTEALLEIANWGTRGLEYAGPARRALLRLEAEPFHPKSWRPSVLAIRPGRWSGAQRTAEFWKFSRAKTLVFFCNGPWCGQSPTNIRSLLRIGYPPSKLKWYRGGMQDWEILGLTTVKDN